MSIEQISFIAPGSAIDRIAQSGTEPTGTNFSDWMQMELGQLNDRLVRADGDLKQLALGEVENLHQVMISLEETKMAFQLALQVRNKLLEAYQEIMRMQV